MTPDDIINSALTFCDFFILLAYMFYFLRLCRGPTLADRAVALDGIASTSFILICILMAEFRELRYMDIVLTMALVNFIGTVAVARYLEKGLPK